MTSILLVLYVLTGFVLSFDYFYLESRKGKSNDLLSTGVMMLLFIMLWLPIAVCAIYCYAAIYLYEIITEEEPD